MVKKMAIKIKNKKKKNVQIIVFEKICISLK